MVGAVVATATAARVAAGRTSHYAGFAAASHNGWWILSGCGVFILVLSMVVTSRWAKATADRTARELNPEFLAGASL